MRILACLAMFPLIGALPCSPAPAMRYGHRLSVIVWENLFHLMFFQPSDPIFDKSVPASQGIAVFGLSKRATGDEAIDPQDAYMREGRRARLRV